MNSTTEKNFNYLVFITVLSVAACRKPYTPPAITTDNNYLVVEGVIAAGQDSTVINLNRTVNLSGKTTHNPELNATVTVQGDQNVSYTIPQVDSGRYAAPALNLDNAHKYRLQITTADGRTYASDYEPVKITPPIDTLRYNIKSDGIDFFTDAHDPSNNTRYYRWDYVETYIYTSGLNTYYIYDPTAYADTNKSVLRRPDQQIHTCYVTLNSSAIILNSSAALKQDVINSNPITQIPNTSEKILHRYSILVKQYALTPDAYDFWYLLKRNTQQLGSIFDAQPSEVKGNVHCTSNPSEPAIGFISVSTISQKRIFIDRTALPAWPVPPASTCGGYSICWSVGGPVDPDITMGNYIPLGLVKKGKCGFPPSPGYVVIAGQYDCVDCRYHLGGKNKAPGFWK
ncbi:MAG: DUF4249 domain-containing protein [Mucilaginibacter sp.]